MEQQNQLQQQQQEKLSSSNYLCRQNHSRWTPTTEQIKLLKELYYINGVRSPTADQIQAICSRLRRYGKIEGKNVFYWFQNHKARERQKKRLIPSSNNSNAAISCWKEDDNNFTKYPNCINPNNINNQGVSCSSSSAGMISGNGQLMGSFGYGAMTMENKFRDCSISNVNNTTQWTSLGGTYLNNYNHNNFNGKITTFDEDHYQEQEQDHYVVAQEIETLPLFPMHNEEHNNNNNDDHHLPSNNGYYTGGYPWSNGGGNGASLELSLNSYGYGCYSHNY